MRDFYWVRTLKDGVPAGHMVGEPTLAKAEARADVIRYRAAHFSGWGGYGADIRSSAQILAAGERDEESMVRYMEGK